MANKPNIRFKGFTDDWEQRKFDELFTGLQNNTLSRSELNYENGTLMDVHYGDILVKFGEYIDVSKHQLPYINDVTIANKYDGSFLKDGDIIIADTAEDSTVGKCTEILGANNYLLISGLHTIPCRPMIKFASKYLGYYMNSSAYRKQLIPLMQGIKVTSISKSSIYDTKLIFPKSISEQAKIGEYFSTLDRLITLHQRKCDEIKKLKKFMLQKMFPKNGEKNPEIRFAGFTDDWEQRKLGGCIVEYNEVTTINNQYPALTSSRKGIFLQIDYFSGKQVASDDNTGYNIVPYGYFTYRHMSDDEIFYFNINDIVENGIVSTLYPVFTTNNKLDSRYLQYQLNNGYEFAKFALLQKQGGSRTYMYLNKLKKLYLTVPSNIEEQKMISKYLMALDHLITLHQRKCDKLKLIKKFMLQNMFPKKG